jgi:lactoylglutathione lyase
MHLQSLSPYLLLSSILLSYTSAHDTRKPDYPKVTLGPEGSDPATTSYFMNHISLNVRNLSRSLDFYTSVFGFRVLFTVDVSPHSSLAYIGHSNGGKNGTGYQTTLELNRDKNNAQGLVELICIDIPGAAGHSSTERVNTFANLGIVVDDLEKTEKRLDEFEVEIYKRTGAKFPTTGPLVRATGLGGDLSGLDDGEFDMIYATIDAFTMDSIYAADPDGNMISIQNPVGPQLDI